MDANKRKPTEQQTNVETDRWKTMEFRKMVVKKITDAITNKSGLSTTMSLSQIVQGIERFEEKVNAAAKNEAEYMARLSANVKTLYSRFQSAKSKPPLLNSSGSEAGKSANVEWKEQVFQKVQRMKNRYFAKLNALNQQMNNKLQQLEGSPQEPKSTDLERIRKNKNFLEYFLSLLKVSKSQITTEFNEKLDQAEKMLLQSIGHTKNASSHHQGQQHSANVQSRQQSIPLQSGISPMEIVETEPSPQALETQNDCHMTKENSLQTKMSLQEQQVAKQNSNSQKDVDQVSIIKGPGNTMKQQTFSVNVNTQEISTSPLVEDSNNHKEISHKPTLNSDEPSAAMEHFLKVLTSVSPEALNLSIGEIREVVYDDSIPTSKLKDGPPMMVQQQKQPSFIPQGGVGSPKNENCSLLQEIKEINNLLLDCEIVIDEKDNSRSAAGEATEHGEGLVIKFLFNAVTINQNLISHLASDKKSIIKPLWLLVPSSYPFSSPIILDKMLMEAREGLKDLYTKAKSKLRLYLQSLNQPWSLGDIAISWERYVRETILDYAHGIGGGTFSSKYGGWEMCQDYD